MATAAQIEANRLNAQRSTGPKTDEGKARVRRNAVKHGMTARTIMPVLPQEDPKELEARTQQAITAMKPRNPLELDLVCRAVRLSGELDRAERVGTAHPSPPFGGRCQALASGGGSAHDLTPPVGRGAVGRGAWGERTVFSEPQGSEVVGIEKRQNEAKSIGC